MPLLGQNTSRSCVQARKESAMNSIVLVEEGTPKSIMWATKKEERWLCHCWC